MALAVSAGCAALVLIIFLITAAFGNHILDIAGLTADEPLDSILFSSGAGFAILQLLLGILGLMAGLTVRSVMALLILLAIAGWGGWKSVFHLFRESAKDLSGVFKSGAARAHSGGIHLRAIWNSPAAVRNPPKKIRRSASVSPPSTSPSAISSCPRPTKNEWASQKIGCSGLPISSSGAVK